MDFVARDKHGHIVRDLRPEEVSVFENDVRQQMRALTFFDKGAPSEPQPEPAAAGSSPVLGSTRKWQELRSMNVVTAVFAGPFEPLSDTGAVARDLMRDILTAEMRADTLVGVFTLDRGQLRAVLPYTNDASEVGPAMVAAVERLTGRPVKGALSGPVLDSAGTPRAALSPAMRAAVDRVIARLMRPEMVEDDDTRAAIEGLFASLHNSTISAPARPEGTTESEGQLLALLHLMQAQTEFPGRKLLFYISDGLAVDAQFKELPRAVVGGANRAGVTLCGVHLGPLLRLELAGSRQLLSNAVNASYAQRMAKSDDPVKRDWVLAPEVAEQSLHADTRMNLENLAKETGGELISGNDVREKLQRQLEDERSHWELTYTPADLREDGRFRSLKVTVSRPSVMVTARSGYYALPLLNGEQIALFEYAPLMALNARPAPRDLEFHAEAVRFRPGPKTQYAMVFEAPLRQAALERDPDAESKRVTAHLSFLALLKAADGHVVDRVSRDQVFQATGEAALQSQTATFAAPLFVPSGRYTLESAVVDRNSGKASTRRAVLVVESGAGLALSDLSLVRRLEPILSFASGRDPLIVRMNRVIPQVLATAHVGGDLGFYAVVYPDARSVETMAVTLELRQDGQVVTSKQFGPLTSRLGAQPMLTSLPVQGLKPGEYETRLTVRQGQVSRQKVLPVTLVE